MVILYEATVQIQVPQEVADILSEPEKEFLKFCANKHLLDLAGPHFAKKVGLPYGKIMAGVTSKGE